ncbi:MAG: magnesium chelatase domain-containing protein, partial [Candidatus Binatia bacterium]
NVGTVCEAIRRSRPSVAVIDSIQTVFSSDLESAPGSVAQIREVSAQLVRLARELECAMVLIGHVTKEGFLAGPRVLEHLVDTVLYFEGDRNHAFRILRAVKNRFGPANEIGVFEMSAQGLSQVVNPSEVLSGGLAQSANGSVVTPCLEGSRPMLVEVQALVSPGLPGSARRTTLGVDHNRVAMIAAVMEKHMGLTMISHDIFVNTAGGVRIDDPGVDLAVLASLASSYLERSVARGTVVLGEIGLTGDVRAVSQVRARVREAARLGFTRAVLPAGSLEQARSVGGLEALGVESVSDAWELVAATSR